MGFFSKLFGKGDDSGSESPRGISKEEALEISRRFWALVGEGEGDIRQVFGPGE